MFIMLYVVSKMKNKHTVIFEFISEETGIKISPFLESVILKPQKITLLNNIDLEKIVKEFAPISKKYKHTLDGPSELRTIHIFEMYLMCRICNKLHLQKLLEL